MSLTPNEIENYLVKIFTGISYIYINDTFIKFIFPNNEIKQKANLIYERSYSKALSQGMLSVEDLEKLIEERNLITEKDKLQLKKLYGQLEAQNVLLSKTTRVKANQDRIKTAINRLKGEIKEIEAKKNSRFLISAETKAEEERTFYIFSRCVYKEDDELYWPKYGDALNETDLALKDRLLLGFLKFYSGIPVEAMREIARSSLWRIRYVNSVKTSEFLFGVPTSEYTTDQLSLAYWSNYYQNIYEMLPEDRPSDIVIEDDDSLDAYMKAYYEERTREDAKRKSKSKNPGKLSAFDSEEVIVTRSHELYQDIAYDKPREAQRIKDRVDLKKRTKRG